jgi:hypothetical protein
MHHKYIPADYALTIGKNLTNSQDTKVATKRMIHRPLLGMFQTEQYLPAHVLPSIVLEFTLATGIQGSVGDVAGPSPTFAISNCSLVCEKVDVSPSYTSELLGHIEKNGLNLEFETAISQSFNVAALANFQNFRLGAHRDLSNVWFTQVPQAAVAAKNIDSTNTFARNTLTSYSYTINGILESQPVLTTVDNGVSIVAYLNTMKCNNLLSSFYAGTGVDYTLDTHSFYGYPFSASDEPSDDSVLIEKNLSLDLTFSGAEIATMYLFFTKHSMVSLKDNNIIVFRSR